MATPNSQQQPDEVAEHSENSPLVRLQSLTGYLYQTKLLMLLFCMGDPDTKFRLATEVKAAGKFDDVVFEYVDGSVTKTILIQTKHCQVTKPKLNLKDFLSRKEFGLQHYLKSYLEIKSDKGQGQNNDELQINAQSIEHLMLFTNREIEDEFQKKYLEECSSVLTFFQYEVDDAPSSKFYTFRAFPKELLEHFKTVACDNGDAVDEFRSKLILGVGQPDEQKIESIIKKKLGAIFNDKDKEVIFSLLLVRMAKWMTHPNAKFLTNSDKKYFLQQAEQQLPNAITDSELTRYNKEAMDQSTFYDETTFRLELVRCLSDKCSKLVHVITDNPALTCIKVIQIFKQNGQQDDRCAAVKTTDLKILEKYFSDCLKEKNDYVIILECNHTTNRNESKAFEPIKEMAKIVQKSDCSNRMVVISKEQDNFQKSLPDYPYKWQTIFDETKWEDVHKAVKALLYNKWKVTLHGTSVNFKDIIHEPELNSLSQELHIHMLNQFVQEESWTIGRPAPPAEESYIHREFKWNVPLLTEHLADAPESELLVFSGIELTEFKKKVRDVEVCCYQGDWSVTENCHFLVLDKTRDRKKDLQRICKAFPGKNIHYLEFQNNLASSSFKRKRFVDRHQFTEEDMIKMEGKIRIISGDAGMGKSTILTSIMRKMKTLPEYLSYWAIRIRFADCTDIFDSKQKLESEDDIVTFFSKTTEFRDDPRGVKIALLKIILKRTGKIIIFLDGFDEVCPTYTAKAVELVKELEKSKVEQVWLSTRPDFKDTFNAKCSYILAPFTKDQQENFFTKVWMQDSKHSMKKAKDLYKDVICTADYQELAGNPLFAKLIADVYKRRLHSASEPSDDPLRKSTNADLFHIYNNFVDNKFTVYYEEKLGADKRSEILKEYLGKDKLRKKHSRFAFKTLFTQEFDNMIKKSPNIAKLARIGIIGKDEFGEFKFIHRTFAEYFLAELLYKLIQDNFNSQKMNHHSETKGKLTTFLQAEILKPTNKMIRIFLDKMLVKGKGLRIHRAVLKRKMGKVKVKVAGNEADLLKRDSLGRTPLHLACIYELEEIATFLMENNKVSISERDFLGYGPISYAAATGNGIIIESLFSAGANDECFRETLQPFFQILAQSPGLGELEFRNSLQNCISRYELYHLHPVEIKDCVELFRKCFSKWGDAHVPSIFHVVNIENQHQMLLDNEYKVVKHALIHVQGKVLNEISIGLHKMGMDSDTPTLVQIRCEVSNLKEFAHCFLAAVEARNFKTLKSLILLSLEAQRKPLWEIMDYAKIFDNTAAEMKMTSFNFFYNYTEDDYELMFSIRIIILELLKLFPYYCPWKSVDWFTFFEVLGDIKKYDSTLLIKCFCTLRLDMRACEVMAVSELTNMSMEDMKKWMVESIRSLEFNHAKRIVKSKWMESLDTLAENVNEARISCFIAVIIRSLQKYPFLKFGDHMESHFVAKLIAYAYQEDFLRFYHKNTLMNEVIDVAQLYSCVVDKSFLDHWNTRKTTCQRHFEESRLEWLEMHRYYAQRLLFATTVEPRHANDFVTPSKENTSMTIIQGNGEFFHRTFANYFMADSLMASLTGKDHQGLISAQEGSMWHQTTATLKFLAQEILKGCNKMVRIFLDHMLTKNHEIHDAILKGNSLPRMLQLLINNPDRTFLRAKDALGRTPLHLACLYHDPLTWDKIWEDEIEKDPSLLNITDLLNFSPICYVAATGNSRLLQSLLHHSIDVPLDCHKNMGANEEFKKTLGPLIYILNWAPMLDAPAQLAYWFHRYQLHKSVFTEMDDCYATMFSTSCETLSVAIPNIFFLANISLQYKMLLKTNYEPIKARLKVFDASGLREMVHCFCIPESAKELAIVRRIQDEVAQIPEFEKCFVASIEKDNFRMLQLLVHLSPGKKRKAIWQRREYERKFEQLVQRFEKERKYNSDTMFALQILILDLLAFLGNNCMHACVSWSDFFETLKSHIVRSDFGILSLKSFCRQTLEDGRNSIWPLNEFDTKFHEDVLLPLSKIVHLKEETEFEDRSLPSVE